MKRHIKALAAGSLFAFVAAGIALSQTSVGVFTCAAGNWISGFLVGGTPVCTAPPGSGTVTQIIFGEGLTGGTITGTGTVTAQIQPPGGRLTLTANTPVMIASASAQTTLRYDCYAGGTVPYYNGTIDLFDTIASCEVTDAMVSAASAGQVVSGNVYDVWWVHSGANRICLAMSANSGGGGGWSADTAGSNTARGTGYTQLDYITRGFITNKNAITNCFNGATNYGSVTANFATYLGTVYASANGQVSWTLGAAASGGTAGLLGVWNYYNRVSVATVVTDNGANYNYSTATIRQARASAGNQISFVLGVQEDGVAFSYISSVINSASSNSAWGVGFDSTTVFSGQPIFFNIPSTRGIIPVVGAWAGIVGFHVLSANEEAVSGIPTFDQDSLNALSAQLRM